MSQTSSASASFSSSATSASQSSTTTASSVNSSFTSTRSKGRETCKTCNDFELLHKKSYSARIKGDAWHHHDHHATHDSSSGIKELQKGASTGCKRSQVLLKAIPFLGPKSIEDFIRLKSLPTSMAVFLPRSCIEVFPSDSVPSDSCGFPPIGTGRHRYANADSTESYEAITMAINDCILNHPYCRPSSTRTTPKRLLKVPTVSGASIQVIHTADMKGEVEFTALSHCWGVHPLPKLLKRHGDKNIVFQWTDLPRSFQDACTVTRNLFHQYIWIDSLCIIQDDPADWKAEAAKMGSIYERAYVTISATDACGSTEGFLHQRYTSHRLEFRDGNTSIDFTVRSYNDEFFNSKQFHFDRTNHEWLNQPPDVDPQFQNPLQLRGWCFQERLMSKRVLHFKRYEFFLECNSGYRCECSGMSVLRKGTIKLYMSLMLRDENLSAYELMEAARLQIDLYKPLTREKSAVPPAADPDVRFMQMWQTIVEIYSRTNFTYSEDVLPALGSLAMVFNAKRPTWTYVAGLWKEDLLRSLLWQPDGDAVKVATRSKPLTLHASSGRGMHNQPHAPTPFAPSFSWANITGRSTYKLLELGGKSKVEVLAADAIGDDKFGDVSSGYIVLRGRAVAIRFPRVLQTYDKNFLCTSTEQDIEICKDTLSSSDTWEPTNRVASGIETMHHVSGFDTVDHYISYFRIDL